MASETRWLLTGQVLYTDFSGGVTVDEIEATVRQQQQHLSAHAQGAPIHLIVDSSAVTQHPRNIPALRHTIRHLDWSNIASVVLISDDFFHRHLAAIFTRLNSVRLHHASSLKQAYRYLSQTAALPNPTDWPDGVDDTMPQRPLH